MLNVVDDVTRECIASIPDTSILGRRVNIAHALDLIATWVTDYNTERPHSALGYQTPVGFAANLNPAIARPAARDESSARRAMAQPAPNGVNITRTLAAAG